MTYKKICAVVVTYNRLELLKECIHCLISQTRKLDEIIVVNNGSSDGTLEWLNCHENVTVINQKNSGSGGGQNAGVKAAYRNGHDWIWCMDDDTMPDSNALAAFVKSPGFMSGTAGFLASRIIFENGEHQRLSFPLSDPDSWFGSVISDHCIGTEMATFVSVLFNRKAIEQVGLPCSDFFIIWDDSEFTKRVSDWGKSWFVLDSVAIHKTPDQGSSGNSTRGIKFKYHQKNRVLFIKLQKISINKKAWKISKLLFRDLWMLLLFKINPQEFFWTIKGVFSQANIEKV